MEREPGAWGYNWATLPLGHINTVTWTHRLGLDARLTTLLRKKNIVANSKEVKTGWSKSQPAKLNKDFKIGTWNVLSFYRHRALTMLLDQVKICKTDITFIQEIRWNATGVIGMKEYTVFYSCQKLGIGCVVSIEYCILKHGHQE
jgi:hypothetical protein